MMVVVLLSAFILVGGLALTWFGGFCIGVDRGNKKLAEREEAFQRLVSGDQEQQGPYRTRQLIHDGHCAEPENVVEQLVCTMRVQELEFKVKELEAKMPKPPTGIMMPWGWRENPKPAPTSLPGPGRIVRG